MNKFIVLLVAAVCLLINPSFSGPQNARISVTENYQSIVYITKTGKKYHSGDCSYLRQSKIKKTLKEAKAGGYTACSRCRP